MTNTETIKTFVETRLLPKGIKVTSSEPLFSSGAIDSLGVLELIAFLEKTFHIVIDTQKHELKEFDSLDLIEKLVSQLSRDHH